MESGTEFDHERKILNPSISLIVVGYRSDAVWEEFFDSLQKSTRGPEHVVVVENSPIKPRIKHRSNLKISVFHLPENPGYGGAANYGYSKLTTHSDLILICNPDLRFESDTIEHLSAKITADHDIGIVGPSIVGPDGANYPTGRAFPRLRIGLGHALLGTIWSRNPWTQKYLGVREGSDPRIVDWVSGACMMVRRDVFDSIRGFDPEYFMFVEDVDLCFRALQKGWKCLLVPEATVVHHGGHSTQFRKAEMARAHHQSMQRFLSRLYNRRRDFLIRASVQVGLKLRAGLISFLSKRKEQG